MDVEQLVRAAGQGDQAAWCRLAQYLGPKLRRLVETRYCRLDSQDLVQDTYIVILGKIGDFEFRSEAEFMSWVHKIARFMALAALRQWQRRERIVERAKGQAKTPSPRQSTLLDRQERLDLVMREVEKLADPYQLAVENILSQGTTRDLAQAAGVSWGSARCIESRLFKQLRERLRPSTPS